MADGTQVEGFIPGGVTTSVRALRTPLKGNPDVPNTACRHVAKAMTRVHPLQREQLLREIIKAAEMGLGVIRGNA